MLRRVDASLLVFGVAVAVANLGGFNDVVMSALGVNGAKKIHVIQMLLLKNVSLTPDDTQLMLWTFANSFCI